MNLKQLEYFESVARNQHITQASYELHVVQPALSKIIKQLENELTYPLFDRRGRNIYINDNGKIFLKYTNYIKKELSDMQQQLKINQLATQKTVTVLLKSTPLVVVHLVSKFREANPDISIRLITYNRNTHLTDLEYDFIIDSQSTQPNNDDSFLLSSEPIVLAVPKNSELAGRKISLSEAASYDFITLPHFSRFGQDFLHFCKEAGFIPNIALQTSDYNTIQEMVANDFGIAFVPKFSWGFQRNDSLSFTDLVNPGYMNYISLSWDVASDLSPAAQTFLEFTRVFGEEHLKSI